MGREREISDFRLQAADCGMRIAAWRAENAGEESRKESLLSLSKSREISPSFPEAAKKLIPREERQLAPEFRSRKIL
jgi:hypothetical protein